MKSQDNKYYRTTSFYISAFLFSKGMELTNIEPIEAGKNRSQFVFIDTPEREKLINSFNFAREDSPEVLVDTRKLIMAIKMLKDKLYQYQNKF